MRWSGLRNSVRCAGGGAVAGRRFQRCRPGCRASEACRGRGEVRCRAMLGGERTGGGRAAARSTGMLRWMEACGCCAGRVWRDLEARSLACQAALRCHGGSARRLHSAVCCANPFRVFTRLFRFGLRARGARRDRRRAQSGCDSAFSKPYQRQDACEQITHPCKRAGSLAGSAQKRWRGRRQGKPVAAPLQP